MKNILVIGDVVGKCGRELVFSKLKELQVAYLIDFTIVNGENATTGNGINEKYAEKILEAGADLITLGNHSFDKKDISHLLDSSNRIIRPLNLDPNLPGDGISVFELPGWRIGVINLLGKVYLDPEVSDPFQTLNKAVENLSSKYPGICIFVDFHAEATSEKQALAYYMDGRITALFGTHTHVQTNDGRILAGKTGYITDIGMTGSQDSVIGLKKDIALARFLGEEKKQFRWGETEPMINGAVFTIDETKGETLLIKLINQVFE